MCWYCGVDFSRASAMTPTATTDHNSVPAAAPTLSDAVRAVTEYRREVEVRRMAQAARQRQGSSDWMVPVPRSRLEVLEQQAREAALLRRMLASEPVAPALSSEQPVAAERRLPTNARSRRDARPAPSA
jgi:hypothetical protein